jgi:hypothetical protein
MLCCRVTEKIFEVELNEALCILEGFHNITSLQYEIMKLPRQVHVVRKMLQYCLDPDWYSTACSLRFVSKHFTMSTAQLQYRHDLIQPTLDPSARSDDTRLGAVDHRVDSTCLPRYTTLLVLLEKHLHITKISMSDTRIVDPDPDASALFYGETKHLIVLPSS